MYHDVIMMTIFVTISQFSTDIWRLNGFQYGDCALYWICHRRVLGPSEKVLGGLYRSTKLGRNRDFHC